jgi:hypothetical protein
VGSGTLAADDDRVYWSECTYEGRGGGVIRALPRGAAPGSAPAPLTTLDLFSAFGSLTVLGGALYWTAYDSFATIHFGGMSTAPIATLLAGTGSGTALEHAGSAFGATAIGGQIYFGAFHGLLEQVTMVARLYEPGDLLYSLSILPYRVDLTAIAEVGDVLAVTGVQADLSENLYAFRDAGAGPILVAEKLQTAAVAGPNGATFVDAAGNLVAIAPADLQAAAFNRAP